MDYLEKTSQSKLSVFAQNKNGTPVFVFDIPEGEPFSTTPEDRKLLEKMKKVADLYRDQRDHSTLDLEVTEKAFKRLEGRPGFSGVGYSRLVQILDGGKISFHIILSPFTTVSAIKHSDLPGREELVLVAKGLNIFEGQDIRFELAPVNSKEVANIEDRSDVNPKDLIKIEFIPNETAQLLIAKNQQGG